jgi:hypothetical protein
MTKDELRQHLFSERTNVYVLLDGASVKGLTMKLYQTNPPHYCLFRGDLTPDVAEVAPYLVGLIDGQEFTDWVLGECFGKHWGVFVHSLNSLTEMRRHFRALIYVHDEAGKPMIFRYYDPRVLRTYLLTCNSGELKTFYGKVDTFFAEKDDTGFSSFKLENGELKEVELN